MEKMIRQRDMEKKRGCGCEQSYGNAMQCCNSGKYVEE